MQKIFDINLFREKGFIRKRCKGCGEYFWTLDPEREYCGDPPCSEYSFINNPISTPFHSIDEVREAFLNFFEKHGHKRINRYPVVARWRNDVYLVGASIYDFQPWVTEGIIPPPANPLAISQPCIRLTDVDNVGKTGRHLTFFEMMAHHAFNIGKQYIYWNNETVQYSFELLTKIYRIPEEELTYKEGLWIGGGNAGEDFEVLVRGLEVATLVFMHYRTVNGEKVPIKNRIVDTGYGLERIFWLIKGSPTVYDAIFKNEIDWLTKYLGLNPPDKDLFSLYSKKMSIQKEAIDTTIIENELSRTLGLDINYVCEMLHLYEGIYSILDHSRALIFMLGDGIVPSNAGAGYLARLLIRRSLRYIHSLELDIKLVEIISNVYSSLQKMFPEYREKMDVILEIIDYEEKRYWNLLKRGFKIIGKIMDELRKRNVKAFPVEELVKLYDSHGISPEVVKKMGEKYNINVSIPSDFFSRLVETHERREVKHELKKEMPIFSEKIPATQRLYYSYPYKYSFKARVLKVLDGVKIILDRTLFYPEGGGQPSDRGVLIYKGQRYNVIDVKKFGNIIVHICDYPGIREGCEVEGYIDIERRKELMRAHTATHIILGAARRVLGYHVWQAGAQKGVEKSRLDITHFRNITPEERKKIELISNKIVMENREVRIHFMSRNDAERKYGFELYQGGVVPEKNLRIVEIEGWDAEACGGLHVSRTGEIGIIKIIQIKRIQDGIERIIFKVGRSALNYICSLEEEFQKSLHYLSLPEGLYDGIVRIVEENRKLREKVKRLEDELKRKEIVEMLHRAPKIGEITFICKLLPQISSLEKLIEYSKMIMELSKNTISCLFIPAESRLKYVIMLDTNIVKKELNAIKINEIIVRELEGKGGGKNIFAQGEIPKIDEKRLRDLCIKIYKYISEVYEA